MCGRRIWRWVFNEDNVSEDESSDEDKEEDDPYCPTIKGKFARMCRSGFIQAAIVQVLLEKMGNVKRRGRVHTGTFETEGMVNSKKDRGDQQVMNVGVRNLMEVGEGSSLWANIIGKKYFRSKDGLDALVIKSDASVIWCGIVKGCCQAPEEWGNCTVAKLWTVAEWRWDLLKQWSDENVCLQLEAINLVSDSNVKDKLAWKASPSVGDVMTRAIVQDFGITLWSLWKWRNAYAFRGERPPMEGWIKLNTDVRAELRALVQGLELAWLNDYRIFEVEMASKALVDLVLGKSGYNLRLLALLMQCKMLIQRPWHVTIHHCFREATRVADKLANLTVFAKRVYRSYRCS
ncbi:hypothetical protein GH714_030551 [Hevea brasiliensis]|uniref:RNase H type-1 domain-containing protein n=1 Tax=Hevea brasiliensis TaxID=3981 RepID=A0A6A6LNB3_HEVBR|nr:hypothetical protein GH714_030551 [Hevea brasiliensis]